MTTRPTGPAAGTPSQMQFQEPQPPEDMNNTFHINEPAFIPSLIGHFGNRDTTIVTSEAPLAWNPSQQEGSFTPDLLIAFDVDRQGLRDVMGYSIQQQGKPPDFVLEIGSATTGHRDMTVKRDGYAALGVPEYWRFDPSGGQFHDAHLGGHRLESEVYLPVIIHQTDERHYWGHSDVLDLDVCWEEGELRWYDPVAQRYLSTFDDERDARVQAEARVHQLEEELGRRQNL